MVETNKQTNKQNNKQKTNKMLDLIGSSNARVFEPITFHSRKRKRRETSNNFRQFIRKPLFQITEIVYVLNVSF